MAGGQNGHSLTVEFHIPDLFSISVKNNDACGDRRTARIFHHGSDGNILEAA